VSVAGDIEKGKLPLVRAGQNQIGVEYSRWPLRQGLRVLVTFEVPHQQNQKHDDREHAKAKVVPSGIRTAA
jgi:hypothetical protein